MPARSAAEVIVVGIEALGWFARGAHDLGLLQLWCDGADDTCRHFILKFENVFQPTLEALRPQMRASGGVDELAGDPQTIGGLPDASLQHVAHTEFATDPLHIDRT